MSFLDKAFKRKFEDEIRTLKDTINGKPDSPEVISAAESGFVRDGLSRKRQQNHQMDFNWRVLMPSTSQTGLTNGDVVIADVGEDAQVVLASNDTDMEINHRVTDIAIPFKNFDVRETTNRNSHLHTAGTRNIGAFSVTLDEMEDGLTTKYIDDWQHLIANDDGTYNPPALYKREIRLIRTSNNGLDLHIVVIKGCFPSEVAPVQFSYDSSEVTKLNVTFSCDTVEQKILPVATVKKMIEAKNKSIRDELMEFTVNAAGRSFDFKIDPKYLKYKNIIEDFEEISDNKYYSDEVRRIKKFF